MASPSRPPPADSATPPPYSPSSRNTQSARMVEEEYIQNDPFQRGFESRAIRNRFVVKVYCLVFLQITFCIGMISMCMFVEPVRDFLFRDIFVMIGAIIGALIFYITLACCKYARRIVPLNYILLSIMTLFFATFMGAMSVRYSTYIVYATMGLTGAIVLIVSLIAALPWFDITGWGIYLCLAGMVLSIFGMVALILGFVFRTNILFLVYSALIALLVCFYLMYDTQLILGGRKYEISAEEYILGAVSLFVDIVYIFTALLALCGHR